MLELLEVLDVLEVLEALKCIGVDADTEEVLDAEVDGVDASIGVDAVDE